MAGRVLVYITAKYVVRAYPEDVPALQALDNFLTGRAKVPCKDVLKALAILRDYGYIDVFNEVDPQAARLMEEGACYNEEEGEGVEW